MALLSVSTLRVGSGWAGASLVCAGLFTIGWDRIAAFEVGTYNLKFSVVAFAFAIPLLLVAHVLVSALRRPPKMLSVAVICSIFGLGLGAVFATRNDLAAIQAGAYLLSAVVPFIAIIGAGRLIAPSVLVFAFVSGAVFSALFGLYQLASSLFDLPEIIKYDALGGGLPRISAFTYEAAYFGYYMILAAAASMALGLTQGRRWGFMALGFFACALLANTRAALLTVPIAIALLGLLRLSSYVPWRRKFLAGRSMKAASVAFLVFGMVISALVFSGAGAWIFERFTSIFDPSEPTSNAPRIRVLQAAAAAWLDRPLVGVGPGNFFLYLERNGIESAGATPNGAIANNAYLQALLDGGPIALTAQVALIAAVVVIYLKSQDFGARALAAGWLAVAAVAFLATSYFWDMKMWAVLAMIVVLMKGTQAASPRGLAIKVGRT